MLIACCGNFFFQLAPFMVLDWKSSSFLYSIPQVVLTWLTNKLSTGVLDRTKTSQTYCRTSTGESLHEDDNIGKICLFDYCTEGCFLMLYSFNHLENQWI